VNHHVLKASDTVISNASCTTNCLAPLVKPLNDKIGLGERSDDHDPRVHERPGSDGRVSRRPAPRALGHAQPDPDQDRRCSAVGLVLPELNGKLDGYAIRVPTINVSVVDLSFIAARDTTVEEVNAIMKEASEGSLKGILGYNEAPLVRSTSTTTRLRRRSTLR
jgi:Glyceraldehyde-3-phosphate dehydrogenase/erythrose-4-phosphate dehydrogenase